MANILVTGIAGFIGAHVAKKLMEAGHTVDGVDDLSGGYADNIPPGVRTFRKLNLVHSQLVDELFARDQYDYVFHLAAYAAEGLSHFIRRYNYTNNLIASVNIINNCVRHKIKRLIFTSSMSVFGSQTPPFTESMPFKPEDPYAIAKSAVEMDIHAAHEMWGLEYTIFRPHNVMGPGQNYADSYRNVVGIFLNQAQQRKPLTVFGDGTQIRAFSDISDVAQPIADCIESRYESAFANQTFNIGGDTPYTINQLVENVRKVVLRHDNYVVKVVNLETRFEVHTAYSSHEKLRKVYFFKSNKNLENSLTDFWLWIKKSPQRLETKWDVNDLEVIDKMPSKWHQIAVDSKNAYRKLQSNSVGL